MLPIRKQGHKLSTSDKGVLFDLIVSSLLRGLKPTAIKKDPDVVKFGLSTRSIEREIKKAKEIIYNRPIETVERKRNLALQMYEQMYRDAKHDRDKLEALKEWCRLNGLSDIKIDVTLDDKRISDEQLVEIVLNEDKSVSP